MLAKCSPHVEFRDFLQQQISLHSALEKERLMSFSGSLTKMWFLSLDPAIPLLSRCLSSSVGRPVNMILSVF